MLARSSPRGALRGLGLSHTKAYARRRLSIDEFNKNKKDFTFGADADNFGRGSRHRQLQGAFEDHAPLEEHPKLQGLDRASPEYKYQLMLLQQDFQNKRQQQRAQWELAERVKGVGAGLLALVGILAAYQLVTNHKYLRAQVRGWWAPGVDVSRVLDMNDPKGNTRAVAHLAERLGADADAGFLAALRDSRVPGLYLFGAVSGKRLPARAAGFDGMLLADVCVQDDYLVAIDDKGRVLHYAPGMASPVYVHMPAKVRQVVASGGRYFYVARNGRAVWCGGRVDPATQARPGWLTSGAPYAVSSVALDVLARGERLALVAAGAEHLLLLTSHGRLLGVCSARAPASKGQYGLPRYAQADAPEPVPTDVAFDLVNLNNEVVTASSGAKAVRPRTFAAIAATAHANAALDLAGALWTWGDNALCQCGRPKAVADDIQPVPRAVYALKDLARILRYSVADRGLAGRFSADALAAANNTFYVKMSYRVDGDPLLAQDLVLSFGDGLRGQLGISRYLHMTPTPHVLKSLVGLREFDEATQTTRNIGIKSIVPGGDHTFVTLDNHGAHKDVLVFGDNLQGQFGNGRTAKSARPAQIPKLLEPENFDESTKKLVLKLNDQTKNRLQLADGNTDGVEQVLAAGELSSAIYYRRK
ncbi:RCC1/BLIP-II protein [Metschnikowia bicuspidata var. bicuspidata NRRL YB-4993]|uniref:RCC1/BLIP-II protein n=1 Tax=Metschnikowia bicuspidata var. bicuspidata NRRL YB-4993 TaxID=869754 RepID=A0A1A0HBE8_9ASCO|nr:RCC1/BLIP-II protein [Metschnikowia bicuspidata var. bicuspidata NRRL YB-4993]OBA21336.1 RCC1/BLIP-II protein [Metschnikowia bicuspidata var. bicuspidata NRRL YB-4993]